MKLESVKYITKKVFYINVLKRKETSTGQISYQKNICSDIGTSSMTSQYFKFTMLVASSRLFVHNLVLNTIIYKNVREIIWLEFDSIVLRSCTKYVQQVFLNVRELSQFLDRRLDFISLVCSDFYHQILSLSLVPTLVVLVLIKNIFKPNCFNIGNMLRSKIGYYQLFYLFFFQYQYCTIQIHFLNIFLIYLII